jgi:hypothetical protein
MIVIIMEYVIMMECVNVIMVKLNNLLLFFIKKKFFQKDFLKLTVPRVVKIIVQIMDFVKMMENAFVI